jgi:hypothetical protein
MGERQPYATTPIADDAHFCVFGRDVEGKAMRTGFAIESW